MLLRLLLLAIVCCCLLPLSGCGDASSTALHGTVTFDGAPVTNGSIVFLPATGEGPKAAAAIEEGKYTIPADVGLKPGGYRVEVSWHRPTGRKVPSADPGIMMDETKEAVPAKFNSDSTLTAELAAGDVEKDFALRSN
jgi:hypothetical protein